MINFNEVLSKHLDRLNQYVPIVAKVHGGTHPEFYDVKKQFDKINEKLKVSDSPDLTKEFEELRRITDNYTVPLDVCESYEAVYKMLEEVDTAYNN